jgi:hypothetical protein
MLERHLEKYKAELDDANLKYTHCQKIFDRLKKKYAAPIWIPLYEEIKHIAFHTLDLMDSSITNDQDIHNKVIETVDHCNRLVYDAYEMLYLLLINNIKTFQEKYKKYNIVQFIPTWIDIKRRTSSIQEFISDMSKVKIITIIKSEVLDESDLTKNLKVLEDYCDIISHATEELEIEIANKRRSLHIQIIIGVAIPVIICIVVILFDLYFNLMHTRP